MPRFQMDLTQRQTEVLNELRGRMQMTRVGVMRQALVLLKTVLDNQEGGGRVALMKEGEPAEYITFLCGQ